MQTYAPSAIKALVRGQMRPMSRDKADTLLLLGACLLVLLPHFFHLPAWSVVACVVLLAWRAWITFRGNRLPPRWLLLPLAVAAMAGVFATYRSFLGQQPGVMMLVLLLALKQLEMHAKRDVFVVVYLGYFLMLANFFHSQSIGAAALMLVAVSIMLTAQMSFQYTGMVPPLKQRLFTGLRIVALAIPLALIAFILFPRIEGPLWRLPGDARAGRTGLSNEMSPGDVAQLALSEEVAFRVNFNGAVPPNAKLYWRGPVLEHYDGRTWTENITYFPPPPVMARGLPIHYEVTLEPHNQHWLFALDVPQLLPVLEKNSVRITDDLQILARNPIRQRLRYDASSVLDYTLQPDALQHSLSTNLQLPADYNPRTMALAARLRQQYHKPLDMIHAVLRLFREEGFVYTLEPPPLGQHVVDDFLFSTRAGFCEHYAGAFVVLMRALGIPARVITGYQGGEINDLDGFMVVRQSDAHAWAEVWLEKRGWIRIDPTVAVTPERISRSAGNILPQQMLGGLITLRANEASLLGWLHSWRRGWRQSFDAVTNAWNQWVLNYTPTRQKSLLQSLGFSNPDWRTLTLLLLAAGSLSMGIIALMLLKNRQAMHPADRMYQDLCRQMARYGYARALHEGPATYRARLTAADSVLAPEKQAAASRFLHLYETIRYGASSKADVEPFISPAVISAMKQLLNKCK